MEKGNEEISRRYPAAYRRLYEYFSRRRPDADRPVDTFRLVEETGFITREAVIRKVLQNADWAREVERGYFAWVDPASSADSSASPGGRSANALSRSVPDPSDADRTLEEQVRGVLKKESEHNRIGVSLTYLKRLCGNPPDETLLRILTDAPWVTKQYGLFRYGESEPENAAPVGEACVQIGMEIDGISPAKEEVLPEKGRQLSQDGPEIDAAVLRSPKTGNTAKSKTVRIAEEKPAVQVPLEIPDEGKEELRVGTVMKIKKKKHAASGWAAVDFGADFGKADAGIPIGPATEKLIGKQVVCTVRFREGKRSVRVLSADSDRGAVAVVPAEAVRNGDRVE